MRSHCINAADLFTMRVHHKSHGERMKISIEGVADPLTTGTPARAPVASSRRSARR